MKKALLVLILVSASVTAWVYPLKPAPEENIEAVRLRLNNMQKLEEWVLNHFLSLSFGLIAILVTLAAQTGGGTDDKPVIACPRCHKSGRIKKAGKSSKGIQRYECNACPCSFQAETSNETMK